MGFIQKITFVKRTLTIDNCKTKDRISENCEECEITFNLLRNKQECDNTKIDANCLIFDRDTDNVIYCYQCKTPYYYTAGQCQRINTDEAGCILFKDAELCVKCDEDKYILESLNLANNKLTSTCQPRYDQENSIDDIDFSMKHCVEKDLYNPRICHKCQFDRIKMTVKQGCQRIQTLANCETYSDSQNCQKCSDGYYLTNTSECLEITSLQVANCLQLSNDNNSCTKCKPEFSVNSEGKCSQINDKYEENCFLDRNQGLLPEEYVCEICNSNFLPINLNSTYICTKSTNFNELQENCNKFKNQSNSFVCLQCNVGYYLSIDECVEQCSKAGESLYLQRIEKIKNQSPAVGEENYYNKYYIDQVNVCHTEVIANCKKHAPNIFIQSPEYNQIDYVCIECKANFIPIVAILAVSNFDTSFHSSLLKTASSVENPDFEQDLRIHFKDKDALNAFPGLTCEEKGNRVIKGLTNSLQYIDNCSYYHLVTIDTQETLNYGCLRCKFGYSGEISQTLGQKPFINQCKLVNSNDLKSDLDGDFDTSTVYSGYTSNFKQIKWNQTPLETYLSVHKCVPDSSDNDIYQHFLFIHYEDIPIFPTKTNYNYHSNTMESYPIYFPYRLSVKYGSNQTQILGRPQRCLEPKIGILFPNIDLEDEYQKEDRFDSINIPLDNSKTVIPANCQLIIVNTQRYVYYTNSYNFLKLAIPEILYCGSCKPGYKSDFHSNYDTQSSNILNYRPFEVDACTEIANCLDVTNNSGNWVNNCSVCEENYIYIWDNIEKTIKYDHCLQIPNQDDTSTEQEKLTKQLEFKYCFAYERGTSTCQVCQKGFHKFENSVCEKIIIPFCSDDFNIFNYEQDANPLDIYFGRNLLFFRPVPSGCNQCDLGFVAIFQEQKTQANEAHVCSESTLLKTDSVYQTAETSQYQANCFQYGAINFENTTSLELTLSKFQCKVCKDGYILAINALLASQKCIEKTENEENCVKLQLIQDQDIYKCIECESDYFLVQSECILKEITYCIEFQEVNQKLVCKTCKDFHMLDTDSSCVKGDIDGCEVYDKEKRCKKCRAQQYLLRIDSKDYCAKWDISLRCQTFVKETLEANSIINCQTCLDGNISKVLQTITSEDSVQIFPQQDTINQDQLNNFEYDVCLEIPNVEYCTKYDINEYISNSSLKCLSCKQTDEIEISNIFQYYLDETNNLCVARPGDWVKDNALEYVYNHPTNILHCIDGYYIKEVLNEQSCVENIPVISGCASYKSATNCQQCEDNLLLSSRQENNSCDIQSHELQNKYSNCLRLITETIGLKYKCEKCAEGYYLDEGELDNNPDATEVLFCKQTQAIDCKISLSENYCYSCRETELSHYLFFQDGKINCSPGNGADCLEKAYEREGACRYCQTNKYQFKGACVDRDSDDIEGCLSYERVNGTVGCSLCEPGYAQYFDTIGTCEKILNFRRSDQIQDFDSFTEFGVFKDCQKIKKVKKVGNNSPVVCTACPIGQLLREVSNGSESQFNCQPLPEVVADCGFTSKDLLWDNENVCVVCKEEFQHSVTGTTLNQCVPLFN